MGGRLPLVSARFEFVLKRLHERPTLITDLALHSMRTTHRSRTNPGSGAHQCMYTKSSVDAASESNGSLQHPATLLPQRYFRDTTSATLLPRHYFHDTTSTTLLPRHYFHDTTSTTLLPRHYFHDTTSCVLVFAKLSSPCLSQIQSTRWTASQ